MFREGVFWGNFGNPLDPVDVFVTRDINTDLHGFIELLTSSRPATASVFLRCTTRLNSVFGAALRTILLGDSRPISGVWVNHCLENEVSDATNIYV